MDNQEKKINRLGKDLGLAFGKILNDNSGHEKTIALAEKILCALYANPSVHCDLSSPDSHKRMTSQAFEAARVFSLDARDYRFGISSMSDLKEFFDFFQEYYKLMFEEDEEINENKNS